MKYEKFIIENFKGASEVEIDLSRPFTSKVFPLVGLNESGKTTILEAIDFFQDDSIEEEDKYKLIHKKDLGSFSGKIRIEATLHLEEIDKKKIKVFLKEHDLKVATNAEKAYRISEDFFENTSYKDGTLDWQFMPNIKVLSNGQRSPRDLASEYPSVYEELKKGLDKLQPRILYYPDFLFDFPEKIYLENIDTLTSEKEKATQKEYSKIIDDILRSINPDYSLTDFLLKLKDISTPASEAAATAIKEQVSRELNDKILTPWNAIFIDTGKSIKIETGNDTTGYFIKVRINEGQNTFLVNERSLGFRWFFGFILFTEFRKRRDGEQGEYLFLFDEPASNLHESSQKKLLDIFKSLTDNAKIIYTTHSPYLLSPEFLLSTSVVIDSGRLEESIVDHRQDIKVIPYRQFVSQSQNEETHYKPLLDILEFHPNEFEKTDNIVFFEGKFDYYTFKWVLNTQFSEEGYNFKLYPGASVDKYENIFREYLAHDKKFIAVFDADGDSSSKGKGAQKRYIDNISQELKKQVFTLKDIDTSFDTFTTEKLFTEDERLQIQQKSFSSDMIYSKSHFNTAIQELFIQNETFTLSSQTIENFKKVFDFIKEKFDALEN